MEVLYPRCAGLDVHAGRVTACVRIAVDATVTYEPRTVSANTRGLLDLGQWLTAHGCTHVAMEATGVYWKPVWHVLESEFTLILANARMCPESCRKALWRHAPADWLTTLSRYAA